ncbi:hypothetical protein AMS68_003278 [Peltaster fructicola]|uniref:Helicase C-terminal domain-containing protein n=1 Tax=Peltaster fructicola TaxID=286661 RepID=A0A6H0XSX2_9PEZI|nr:hypothetical protein AMS68_003278 [Peltaster fructicola]
MTRMSDLADEQRLPTQQNGTLHQPSPIDTEDFIAFGCLVLGSSATSTNDLSDETLLRMVEDLKRHGWLMTETIIESQDLQILRLYVQPPDVAYRQIDHKNAKLTAAISLLLTVVDVSPQTWLGAYQADQQQSFDPWATPHDQSLYYTFNNIQSPAPDKTLFHPRRHKYVREAMDDLLDPEWFTGLKTDLYPYQRRSAALMLQREEHRQLLLDPRLEERTAPNGQKYYYNAREGTILKNPLYYESCRGGILAESMGLGKTLICLALVLATKYHLPKIPAEYNIPPPRDRVATLQEMAITAMHRSSVPWEVELSRLKSYGRDFDNIRTMLESRGASYTIPVLPMRWNRNTIIPPPKTLTLASTTIIVVPRNLCKQWHSEISKHVIEDALKVLVMEDLRTILPHPEILRTYDVILFSRNRFEAEVRDGSDADGRRLPPAHVPLVCRCPYISATRTRDCRCLNADDVYDSPLKHLHFKRLIVDEGHSFTAAHTKAMSVATKLVVADHRWIISGTPAKDLLGVEVGMTGLDDGEADVNELRLASLEQRRKFSSHEAQSGAVKSLGALASGFLQMRPWYAGDSGESAAVWDEHIYRHEDVRKRTYKCFSNALQRTIQSLVIKTQPQDVERDIILPPLSHRDVYLEPSFYDKLTANLFTLVLTANAITSERTDQDYLFHKNSQKPRQQLISNLRQSAFFWTGFSVDDVHATLKNGGNYLAKEGTSCSEADRELLTETLKSAEIILSSKGWGMLSKSHELGLYVQYWPETSVEHWSFDGDGQSMMTGVSQLIEAQKYVNDRTEQDDPGEGLSGLGIKSLSTARRGDAPPEDKSKLSKTGVPSSSLLGEPSLKRRMPGIQKLGSPKKQTIRTAPSPDGADDLSVTTKRPHEDDRPELPEDSPYHKAKIIGSTSTKLSYLITQILRYYKDEKILVFYDGDNVAYYIAQMLELLHIKHEIYAKSLMASLKSEYVVRFNEEPQDRVLLMDVKQAAFGLNISSASRIYFVNPVCRPNIEAQAIKRAHRIGQTRKVFVETLILRGTVEEQIHNRAKRMTTAEHLDAKMLEDDGGIREIIQSARTLPLTDDEMSLIGQMACFGEPQQLWCREGWREAYPEVQREPKRRRSTKAAAPTRKPAQKRKKVILTPVRGIGVE